MHDDDDFDFDDLDARIQSDIHALTIEIFETLNQDIIFLGEFIELETNWKVIKEIMDEKLREIEVRINN